MNVRNLSISRKMILLTLIPCVSYLILASRITNDSLDEKDKYQNFRDRFIASEYISAVIEQTQVERGSYSCPDQGA